MKVATFIALALCLSLASAETHAVLLAGSNFYYNYRHQADVCHAYHLLIENGVNPDNIITMAFDDLANDPENPFPGQVFNQPNGKDVYGGCVIDYKGNDVNAKNFLAVLTGDSATTGGKKVLKSTAADNVFINFADHGGTGLIAVIDDFLYADQLLDALNTMNTKQMYSKLVFYMEACESGSMFTNLPTNLSIFAHTASNPDESSWGFYCPPDDVVGGKSIGSCLGDTWSISWMEDSDAADLTTETLDTQYAAILPRVTQSHPMKYGDQSFKDDTLSLYQGDKKKTTTWGQWIYRFFFGTRPLKGKQEDSRLGKLAYLKAKHAKKGTLQSFKELQAELNSIKNFDTIFQEIDSKLQSSLFKTPISLPKDLSCLRTAVDSFQKTCTKFTDYGLKYTRNLAHLCYTQKVNDLDALFKSVCSKLSLE
jgi:legumain